MTPSHLPRPGTLSSAQYASARAAFEAWAKRDGSVEIVADETEFAAALLERIKRLEAQLAARDVEDPDEGVPPSFDTFRQGIVQSVNLALDSPIPEGAIGAHVYRRPDASDEPLFIPAPAFAPTEGL